MDYVMRLTAPDKSNKWYYDSNPFYAVGFGMPNCTAYAWGRFAEILGEAPTLSIANAGKWYAHDDGYERGNKPKLGAVIVWESHPKAQDNRGVGHVAIVEEIYADGSFLVSESGWKKPKIMWTTKISANCSRKGYIFLGFIYNPAVSPKKKE